jgi:hypothetical protein
MFVEDSVILSAAERHWREECALKVEEREAKQLERKRQVDTLREMEECKKRARREESTRNGYTLWLL